MPCWHLLGWFEMYRVQCVVCDWLDCVPDSGLRRRCDAISKRKLKYGFCTTCNCCKEGIASNICETMAVTSKHYVGICRLLFPRQQRSILQCVACCVGADCSVQALCWRITSWTRPWRQRLPLLSVRHARSVWWSTCFRVWGLWERWRWNGQWKSMASSSGCRHLGTQCRAR